MKDELMGVEKLLHPDGFLNYYAVLGATPSAEVDELQDKINVLYQEAQTNRDHRVVSRRREYQMLLDVLPQARTILTDEARRKRYNAYLHAVEMDLPRLAYDEFFEALMREKNVVDARSDIMTVRDLSRLRAVAMVEHTEATAEAQEEASAAPTEAEQGTSLPVDEVQAAATEPVASSSPVPVAATSNTAPLPAPAAASTANSAPASSGPVSDVHRFSPASLISGAIVGLGMFGCLPVLAMVPTVIATPIALVCGGIVAYVFSLTGEVVDA